METTTTTETTTTFGIEVARILRARGVNAVWVPVGLQEYPDVPAVGSVVIVPIGGDVSTAAGIYDLNSFASDSQGAAGAATRVLNRMWNAY